MKASLSAAEVPVRPADPEIAPLLASLPALDALSEKVARVHGPGNPNLLVLRESYLSLALALDKLSRHQDEAATALDAARCLRHLRGLSQAYTPPANACRSYRALYSGLAELDHQSTPLLSRLAELEAAPGAAVTPDWKAAAGGCQGHAH